MAALYKGTQDEHAFAVSKGPKRNAEVRFGGSPKDRCLANPHQTPQAMYEEAAASQRNPWLDPTKAAKHLRLGVFWGGLGVQTYHKRQGRKWVGGFMTAPLWVAKQKSFLWVEERGHGGWTDPRKSIGAGWSWWSSGSTYCLELNSVPGRTHLLGDSSIHSPQNGNVELVMDKVGNIDSLEVL